MGQRCDPALMAADPVTAFLSIEEEAYGLQHLADMMPPRFAPISMSSLNSFEILGVDTLESHRTYCVEDDDTSRPHHPSVFLCSRLTAGVRL